MDSCALGSSWNIVRSIGWCQNFINNVDEAIACNNVCQGNICPQMYVKGEFVGGCDIITDMMLSGELDKLLETNNIEFDKDAADKVREANS